MKHYVYILKSEKNGQYYKGYTANLEKRVFEHNNDLSRYTKNKGPWKLVYFKDFDNKTDALKFEKAVKKYNSQYLKNLILSFNK